MDPFSLHADKLMGLILCRQPQLLFKMYKFISTVLPSCPEDSVSVYSSLLPGSYYLYTLFPSMWVPELWGSSDTDVLLTEEHTTDTYSLHSDL